MTHIPFYIGYTCSKALKVFLSNTYNERVKVEWSYIKTKSKLRTVEEYTQKKIYYKNKHVKYALFQ
jgi:hypothetical protein